MEEMKDLKASRSIVVKHFGGYDALEIQNFELPQLEGNVEVQVKYCGLNFADLYTRQGLMPRTLPFVLGMECCGVISNVGFESSDFKIGAKVICYDHNGGLYREIVRVPPEQCFIIPDNVDLKKAAAVFVNYLTAYFALFEMGNLSADKTVLIQSCTGGVGCAATQLAKRIPNTKIYGTASIHKIEHAKKNGVDHVFSYENLKEQIQTICPSGFDIILENQSGHFPTILENHLKPLGRMVLLGANTLIVDDKKISPFTFIKGWFTTKYINPIRLIMNNTAAFGLHLGLLVERERGKVEAALGEIFGMIEKGEIEPVIDAVWKFNEVVEATKMLAERRNVGKVLLEI